MFKKIIKSLGLFITNFNEHWLQSFGVNQKEAKTFSYSNRSKIFVTGMCVFVILYATSLFTNIIEVSPIYEVGVSVCMLGWLISTYFDKKTP